MTTGRRGSPLAATVLLTVGLLAAGPASAAEARVACAANFRYAAEEIGSAFGTATGHAVTFSFGSTGQLFAQIAFGAPFDAFLAADRARAAKAVDEGLAVAGSQFTYAFGRIALFSADTGLVRGPDVLTASRFSKLAVAEPSVAPYGQAAVETMRELGVLGLVSDRVVRGLNVAQTYQFVRSGNAELGFVAVSQIAYHAEGSRWIVPARLHRPIRQDAVLLVRGAGNDAAKAFLAFLAGGEVLEILAKYGYGRGE